MGLINISKELHNTPIWPIMKEWLVVECNADIRMYKRLVSGIVYQVEGEDIPKGNEEFYMRVCVVVPGVIGIAIES